MNRGIEIEKGLYGNKAIVTGVWQESFMQQMRKNNIVELELNDGKGWRGKNLEFLKLLPELKSLVLIDLSIEFIEEIHALHDLVNLTLVTYSKTPVNFSVFPNLAKCSFEWIKGSDSLFDLPGIHKLFINNYNQGDSGVFAQLPRLVNLSILNSSIDNLCGLSNLKGLKTLRLAGLRKVTSLQGLQSLASLEELEIQTCKKISAISELFGLAELKRLILVNMGEIQSIKGIEKLVKLETFLFYESTNIVDGDLSPLTRMDSLRDVSFQDRRHYSHKRESLGGLY